MDSYGLVYFYVMDGLVFGFYELGELMILIDFCKVFYGLLMGNCGYM